MARWLIVLMCFISLSSSAQELKGKYYSLPDNTAWHIQFINSDFMAPRYGCTYTTSGTGTFKYYKADSMLVLTYLPDHKIAPSDSLIGIHKKGGTDTLYLKIVDSDRIWFREKKNIPGSNLFISEKTYKKDLADFEHYGFKEKHK